MTDLAVRVKGLGKQYRIGGKTQSYKTFRETLTNTLLSPVRTVQSLSGRKNGLTPVDNRFWALQDVTFEVNCGEVVGIIGRNGAGKSTLLKVLSRITEPTEGYADLYGRVGSLLEVGTGFHAELTGRENIYLNGAILGMKRTEIDRKFDDIVEFAEIEKFIDTPVKRYSSGMYLRLAFSVAAHLEPEILVVDEVLAVGDAAFQKKCLGKMSEVAEGGRTVLFVSHQMNAIRKLCGRCVWLDAGRVRMIDTTVKVLAAYEATFSGLSSNQTERQHDPHAPAQFVGWEITQPHSDQANLLADFGPMSFKVKIEVNQPIHNGIHGIALWNRDNQLMWAWSVGGLELEPGIHELHYSLPLLPLSAGIYSWQVSMTADRKLLDLWYCVPELIVAIEPLADSRDRWTGILNLPCTFEMEQLERQ